MSISTSGSCRRLLDTAFGITLFVEKLVRRMKTKGEVQEEDCFVFPGFCGATMSNAAFLDPGLSAVDKCVWAILRSAVRPEAIVPFPTFEELAKQCQTTVRTIEKAILKLRLFRWITMTYHIPDFPWVVVPRPKSRWYVPFVKQPCVYVYVVHDQPVSVDDSDGVGRCYSELVRDCLYYHGDPEIRKLALEIFYREPVAKGYLREDRRHKLPREERFVEKIWARWGNRRWLHHLGYCRPNAKTANLPVSQDRDSAKTAAALEGQEDCCLTAEQADLTNTHVPAEVPVPAPLAEQPLETTVVLAEAPAPLTEQPLQITAAPAEQTAPAPLAEQPLEATAVPAETAASDPLTEQPLQTVAAPAEQTALTCSSSSSSINIKTTTTTTATALSPTDLAATLVFPSSFSEKQRHVAARYLAMAPQDSCQEVLGELEGRLQAPKYGGKPVYNPLRYLYKLCLLAKSGEFVPTVGIKVAELRAQNARYEERCKTPPPAPPPPCESVSTSIGGRLGKAMERLQKSFEQRKQRLAMGAEPTLDPT